MLRTPAEFEKLLSLIAESEADVVLIGGLAAVLRGANVLTTDVDFAMSRHRQTVETIARVLAPLHPKPEGWPDGLPYIWDADALGRMTIASLNTDLGAIDFLGEIETTSYAELASRADWMDVYGQRIRVASLDDLIAMKKAAGRPKDLLHLMELEALKKLIDDGTERSEDR